MNKLQLIFLIYLNLLSQGFNYRRICLVIRRKKYICIKIICIFLGIGLCLFYLKKHCICILSICLYMYILKHILKHLHTKYFVIPQKNYKKLKNDVFIVTNN